MESFSALREEEVKSGRSNQAVRAGTGSTPRVLERTLLRVGKHGRKGQKARMKLQRIKEKAAPMALPRNVARAEQARRDRRMSKITADVSATK